MNDRKKNVLTTLLLALPAFTGALAQTPLERGAAIPNDAVIYALPASVIEITACTVRETFTAGPYARYAQKYLGVEAATESAERSYLQHLSMHTLEEADPLELYVLGGKDKKAAAPLLRLTDAGLTVSIDHTAEAGGGSIRLTHPVRPAFTDTGAEANISTEQVTLYKTVKTAEGFDKVPVQQNQLVEKNPERRAEEAARFLFNLRRKRLELITGEMEMALSHDGLRAALDEIRRLEDEYLSLFLGKTARDTQQAVFYVTPDATQAKQLYVAFRMSDAEGLLPAGEVLGRPVTLTLTVDPTPPPTAVEEADPKLPRIAYRMPAMVQAQLHDGTRTLFQTRLRIYQLGERWTFPLK